MGFGVPRRWPGTIEHSSFDHGGMLLFHDGALRHCSSCEHVKYNMHPFCEQEDPLANIDLFTVESPCSFSPQYHDF